MMGLSGPDSCSERSGALVEAGVESGVGLAVAPSFGVSSLVQADVAVRSAAAIANEMTPRLHVFPLRDVFGCL
ncbi:hypothetical protein ACHMWU_06640 [Aeromicrobium sp. UC242_57]